MIGISEHIESMKLVFTFKMVFHRRSEIISSKWQALKRSSTQLAPTSKSSDHPTLSDYRIMIGRFFAGISAPTASKIRPGDAKSAGKLSSPPAPSISRV
jgi:hypothetical protein